MENKNINKHIVNGSYNRSAPSPLLVYAESPLDMEQILTECVLALGIEPTVAASCVRRWGMGVVAALFGHRFALRSAEVLALTNKDVSLAGICMVQSVKGGRANTVVMPWHFINQAYTNPSGHVHKLFDTNYKRMYNAALDLGLASKSERYLNRHVTHAGRHALADQLARMGHSAAVGDALNHNSKHAKEWYLKQANLEKDRQRKRAQRRRQNAEKTNAYLGRIGEGDFTFIASAYSERK